jgi:Flp pilus assembly pilin Flp
MNKFQRHRRTLRGATSVEYLVVLTLVFIGATAATVLLGPTLLARYELFRAWALLPIP